MELTLRCAPVNSILWGLGFTFLKYKYSNNENNDKNHEAPKDGNYPGDVWPN